MELIDKLSSDCQLTGVRPPVIRNLETFYYNWTDRSWYTFSETVTTALFRCLDEIRMAGIDAIYYATIQEEIHYLDRMRQRILPYFVCFNLRGQVGFSWKWANSLDDNDRNFSQIRSFILDLTPRIKTPFSILHAVQLVCEESLYLVPGTKPLADLRDTSPQEKDYILYSILIPFWEICFFDAKRMQKALLQNDSILQEVRDNIQKTYFSPLISDVQG